MKLFEPRGSHAIVPRVEHYPGRAPVDAYGNGGFRFAGMSHRGSILNIPSGIYGWAAATPADITLEALTPVLAEAENFEVLLVGTGRKIVPLAQEIRYALKERALRADAMTTGAAVSTFNIMLGEKRRVAAAFLAVD